MGTQVECPNCGAVMVFDPGTQGLKCGYCGSDKGIDADQRAIEEKDLDSAPFLKGWDTSVQTFQCESCGATITTERNITGECPFCGSNFVRELSKRQDIIRPENLVPFKIARERANELFQRWIGRGCFRPGDLKRLKKLQKMSGIYLPFWTYDCRTHADWTAQSGYYYYETETYTAYENGRHVRKTRQVRKVRWVPSRGRRDDTFDDTLILASKGIDEDIAEKVYPFHLNELVPYKPDYLSGWMAEEYSINVHEGWGKAREKVKGEVYQRCARDVPGDTHRFLNVDTRFFDLKYKHILLPIWSAAYHYKKKLYHFLINGQTGEVQGEKPLSWLKIALAVAAGAAAAALLIFLYVNLAG
ncbi:MAG: primosomal protein N' (replication factor Y) - superfamily II helicase [Thermoplasmatota archaeon]